jgi:hypothetical protein
MLQAVRNAKELREKKLLEELNIERLAADSDPRKIKMIKALYSQELNKIMKSKKSAAGFKDFKPKFV